MRLVGLKYLSLMNVTTEKKSTNSHAMSAYNNCTSHKISDSIILTNLILMILFNHSITYIFCW